MWADLNTVEDTPFKDRYDVCICGSGPAGMAAALRLAEKGARVLMLEAGGLEYSELSQDVYAGKSAGRNYYGVQYCRLRFFGGSSNHWAGLCGYFSPLDFGERPIWGMPGWPISFSEAYAQADGAIEFLDLKPEDFDPFQERRWTDSGFVPFFLAHSPPTRVGEKFGPVLKAADNVDVVFNANVTDLTLSEDGRRTSALRVEDYLGNAYTVAADYFVIAFGAIENARFLLNARRQQSDGVGNQHDMVGRCFMEHLQYNVGRFVSTQASFWRDEPHTRRKGGALSLRFSDDYMTASGLGNSIYSFNPNGKPGFGGRLAPLRKIRNNVICSSDYLLEQVRYNNDVFCEGDGSIGTLIEQTPNMDSRVRLDDRETDQFGKPRVVLDWRLSDQDHVTVRRGAEELGKALAREGVARLKISGDVLDATLSTLVGHCHHMGTTRMSSDPRYGVVDRDSKVHGVDNLYMAGSSVFSTGSSVNPTFTIVALSLRLGEHLGARLRLN